MDNNKKEFGQINWKRYEHISSNANVQNQELVHPQQPQRQNVYPQFQADRRPNNQVNMNPSEGDAKHDIPILFGLTIRVPETFFSDAEISFLQSINDKISQLDKKEVLITIPSNRETLRDLLSLFNERNQIGQERQAPSNKEREEQNKQRQGQRENGNSRPYNRQNLEKNTKEKGENNNYKYKKPLKEEEQKRNEDDQLKPKNNYQNKQYNPNNKKRDKSIPRSDNSSNSNNHESRNNNPSNKYQKQHQIVQPHEVIPVYLGPAIQISDDKRYYPISRWFFIDQNCKVPTHHSLLFYGKKNPEIFVLQKLWKHVVSCQELDQIQYKLKDVNLTEESYLNELATLEKFPSWLTTTDKINISENSVAFLLSKNVSNIDISAYNSQAALYNPFDFRAVFTEGDSYDYLRALAFGLFFNILSFQLNQLDIIFAFITNDTLPFSIRIVLYHIFCMRSQGKLTEKLIAHNLYYLFKHTFLNSTIISFSKVLFSQTSNSQETNINQFAQTAQHIVIYQNFGQYSPKVITCSPPQHYGMLFLDCAPDGCCVNLVFKADKYQSCQNAYQKLGMPMPCFA